jgi:hypothetical protein
MWYPRAVVLAALFLDTRTLKYMSVQAPGARLATRIVDWLPGTRPMKALAVSQVSDVDTLVAVVLPVLHTRAPTGNVSGPVVGSL